MRAREKEGGREVEREEGEGEKVHKIHPRGQPGYITLKRPDLQGLKLVMEAGKKLGNPGLGRDCICSPAYGATGDFSRPQRAYSHPGDSSTAGRPGLNTQEQSVTGLRDGLPGRALSDGLPRP